LNSIVQLVAGLPGDAADIGAGDAKISKIAIGAKAQLVKILPVLTILLNAVAKAHWFIPLYIIALPQRLCFELYRLKIANVARQHCRCCMAAIAHHTRR
jgi:hypothetical protein